MTEKMMVARFVDNVMLLGKMRKNLGEIERASGCATGYLSRCKSDRRRSPTLLTALRLADNLGENLVDLCTIDYEERLLDDEIARLEQELEELKRKRAEKER